ncbi:MAG: electron transfer flavoprotein subunit beta/FixA family protein [Spirochaetaceae bacterium]|jgi:electron transfer flavoprotein beta subunit|nr:electron transfer flavoprotein subunit beta/FixA family protein [Spirochaetaceae bacterium]
MKIVVCIKQVPGTTDAKIDPETKRIVREGVTATLNPFDTYAIEEAVLLRKKYGGEVIALSMGPERAQAVLREAISVGADRGLLLSDRAFGGSDTWATSYVLARVIEKIGGVDLVLCGRQAIDGDTAQVGPGIAAHLDWQLAAHVMAVDAVTGSAITVRRMHEDGCDVCELDFPAVVTVVKGINTPRIPTLRGRLASEEAEIPVWKPDDIGADIDKIGLDGSPTRVVKTEPPPPRSGVSKKISGTPGDCAAELFKELKQRGIL